MRATRVADAETFAALAGPFLAAHEPEHNLALGLLGRLRIDSRLYGFDPVFVVAEDAGDVVGCLLRTPPHGVVLSRFASLGAVDAVAEAMPDRRAGLPGAVGPAEVAARFADTWSRLTGAEARLAIRERVHAAAAVTSSRGAGPHAQSRPDDVPTILEWLSGILRGGARRVAHVEDIEATYRRREADPDGAWLVWDDGGVVSLAGYGNPTPSGHSGRPRLHAARAPWTGICDVSRRRSDRRTARHRARILLPLHRSLEPDLERDLRPNRLRTGRRLGSVVVPGA